MALINLAGVRTERRELDEALAAAREGLPLLQEAAFAWQASGSPCSAGGAGGQAFQRRPYRGLRRFDAPGKRIDAPAQRSAGARAVAGAAARET